MGGEEEGEEEGEARGAMIEMVPEESVTDISELVEGVKMMFATWESGLGKREEGKVREGTQERHSWVRRREGAVISEYHECSGELRGGKAAKAREPLVARVHDVEGMAMTRERTESRW